MGEIQGFSGNNIPQAVLPLAGKLPVPTRKTRKAINFQAAELVQDPGLRPYHVGCTQNTCLAAETGLFHINTQPSGTRPGRERNPSAQPRTSWTAVKMLPSTVLEKNGIFIQPILFSFLTGEPQCSPKSQNNLEIFPGLNRAWWLSPFLWPFRSVLSPCCIDRTHVWGD